MLASELVRPSGARRGNERVPDRLRLRPELLVVEFYEWPETAAEGNI
jgi:hypothetical protein